MFFDALTTNPVLLFPLTLTILLAIGCHEFAHALAAYLQGDDTAAAQGRLTLNPFAHIDPVGFVLFVVAGFGWGKPTPFNPYNLRFKRWGGALVSLAGPLSNLLMVVIAATVYKLLGLPSILVASAQTGNVLTQFLIYVIEINIILCIFNLIPIPPLDGSKVLYSLLGPKQYNIINWLERNGFWLLLALVFLGQGILQYIIGSVMLYVFYLFQLI